MLRTMAGGLLCVFVAVACGSEQAPSQFGSSSGSSGSSGAGSSGQFGGSDAGPAPAPVECRKMDIVFVIDNSQSMQEEQENLAKNFPAFVQVIDAYKTQGGESLDYRVAITTTDDVTDQGKFRKGRGQSTNPAVQSCDPGPNNSPWLERTDADVSAFFSCRAQVGTFGSNVERPLEAAKLSVTARIADGENMRGGTTSFIRDDALLAFVILTDEDEGSATGGDVVPAPLKDAALYAADFDQVKSFRGRWAAAVIAGDRNCDTPLGKAAEATRLKQFIASTGKNGVFHSICDGDLTQGLQSALSTFSEACKGFPGVN